MTSHAGLKSRCVTVSHLSPPGSKADCWINKEMQALSQLWGDQSAPSGLEKILCNRIVCSDVYNHTTMSHFLFISHHPNKTGSYTTFLCFGLVILIQAGRSLLQSISSSRLNSWPAGFFLLPRCQYFKARPLAGEVRWGQSSLCKAGLLDRKKEGEMRRMTSDLVELL